MILQAAAQVGGGSAIVLGAGALKEIPIVELAERFDRLVLVEIDLDATRRALRTCAFPQSAGCEKIELIEGDLVGLKTRLSREIQRCPAVTTDHRCGIDRMCAVVEAAQVQPLESGGPYDLVIASAVLSQVYKPALDEVTSWFEGRFPDQGDALRQSHEWIDAVGRMAARAECAFIGHLDHLLLEGGHSRLYLSATTRYSALHATAEGPWASPGIFTMTSRPTLSDYLPDTWNIIQASSWPWVAAPPRTAGQVGNLYRVEAVVVGRADG